MRALARYDIGLGRGQEKHWYVPLREVNPFATLRGGAGLLDLVLNIGVPRVPAVHWPRQADAVGIPVKEVESLGCRTLKITIDDIAPDQIGRAQGSEDKGQFLTRQNTAPCDRRFAQGDGILVNQ